MRALLLSAVATGVAALVVNKLQQSKIPKDPKRDLEGTFEVQADTLPDDEVNRLTDELGAML